MGWFKNLNVYLKSAIYIVTTAIGVVTAIVTLDARYAKCVIVKEDIHDAELRAELKIENLKMQMFTERMIQMRILMRQNPKDTELKADYDAIKKQYDEVTKRVSEILKAP